MLPTISIVYLISYFAAGDSLRSSTPASIAALAAGDPWYVAQSLICQSDSYHTLRDFALAIQLIEEALRVIGKPGSDALVCARSHLLTCWADNTMALRDYRTAQQKLDEAAQYLDHIAPNEEFDRAGWLLLTGKYARITRNYKEAVNCFEEALAALPEQWIVRRAMTATGLAMAYAQMRKLEQSLAVAESLVPLLQTIDASMTNRWFSEYLQEDLLGLFPQDRSVRTFLRDAYGRLPQLTIFLPG